MAEIACYHWALALANAVWTRDWTQRGRQQVTRAGGRARFLGGGTGMGGSCRPRLRSGLHIFLSDFQTGPRKAQEGPSEELRVY